MLRPERQTTPLVFASPHSGRSYPIEFVAAARLDPHRLRRSEDSFVDELFSAAPEHGAPLLAANFPARLLRSRIANHGSSIPAMFEEELPPWVNTGSPRVGAGLGHHRPRRRLRRGDLSRQAALRRGDRPRPLLLAAVPRRAGRADRGDAPAVRHLPADRLPFHAGDLRWRRRPPADFVLGDAHGTTCAPRAIRLVEEALIGLGYTVRRNDPYAGGYITRHYGRPRESVHVLQIEISRALYMDESRIERLACFGAVQREHHRPDRRPGRGRAQLGIQA